MTKLCTYGKKIKKKLVDIDKTQIWLINQVCEDTGLYFDDGYMHRILTGQLATPKIVASINRILDLPDAGEERSEG